MLTHILITTYLLLVVWLFATHTTAAAARRPTIVQQIRRAFPDDPDRAVCIARHESTLNPHAYYLGNIGLFQINWASHRYFDRRRLMVASYNIAAARRVYLDARRRYGNGWSPWATRGMCGA